MSNILVVDDQPANRELIRSLLSRDGHSVLQAESAEAAMEMLEGQRPDLIIVDLDLPGMHGTELIKRLRSHSALASARIALFTESRTDAAMRDFMSLMRVGHVIPKPSEPVTVLAAIRNALV